MMRKSVLTIITALCSLQPMAASYDNNKPITTVIDEDTQPKPSYVLPIILCAAATVGCTLSAYLGFYSLYLNHNLEKLQQENRSLLDKLKTAEANNSKPHEKTPPSPSPEQDVLPETPEEEQAPTRNAQPQRYTENALQLSALKAEIGRLRMEYENFKSSSISKKTYHQHMIRAFIFAWHFYQKKLTHQQ